MGLKYSREIVLNGKKVKYILEYKNVKNVNISITPERGFYISAPKDVDLSFLEENLKKKSSDILDALDKCDKILKGANPQSVIKSSILNRTINLNGTSVNYVLQFKDIKKINLSISLEKGVRVSAPKRASISDVERFMMNNAQFIVDTINKHRALAKQLPKPKKYVTGEYIYFHGEKRTLIVYKSNKNFVTIEDSFIKMYVANTDSFELKSSLMDSFLKCECEKYITKLCKELYPRFQKKGIAYPKEIRFRKMVSCWGNCRSKLGILTFSTYLIQLPPKCMEFIVCHEFTHFLHDNHSRQFYMQLAEFMPDWKKYDDIIKNLQNEIIIKVPK